MAGLDSISCRVPLLLFPARYFGLPAPAPAGPGTPLPATADRPSFRARGAAAQIMLRAEAGQPGTVCAMSQPGWYPDPLEEGASHEVLRFFDGQDWTTRSRVAADLIADQHPAVTPASRPGGLPEMVPLTRSALRPDQSAVGRSAAGLAEPDQLAHPDSSEGTADGPERAPQLAEGSDAYPTMDRTVELNAQPDPDETLSDSAHRWRTGKPHLQHNAEKASDFAPEGSVAGMGKSGEAVRSANISNSVPVNDDQYGGDAMSRLQPQQGAFVRQSTGAHVNGLDVDTHVAPLIIPEAQSWAEVLASEGRSSASRTILLVVVAVAVITAGISAASLLLH